MLLVCHRNQHQGTLPPWRYSEAGFLSANVAPRKPQSHVHAPWARVTAPHVSIWNCNPYGRWRSWMGCWVSPACVRVCECVSLGLFPCCTWCAHYQRWNTGGKHPPMTHFPFSGVQCWDAPSHKALACLGCGMKDTGQSLLPTQTWPAVPHRLPDSRRSGTGNAGPRPGSIHDQSHEPSLCTLGWGPPKPGQGNDSWAIPGPSTWQESTKRTRRRRRRPHGRGSGCAPRAGRAGKGAGSTHTPQTTPQACLAPGGAAVLFFEWWPQSPKGAASTERYFQGPPPLFFFLLWLRSSKRVSGKNSEMFPNP